MIPIFRSSNWAIVTSDVYRFPRRIHAHASWRAICHHLSQFIGKSGIFGPNEVLLNEATSHGQQ